MTSGKNKLIKRIEEYYMYMVIPTRRQTSDDTISGRPFIIPIMLRSWIHQRNIRKKKHTTRKLVEAHIKKKDIRFKISIFSWLIRTKVCNKDINKCLAIPCKSATLSCKIVKTLREREMYNKFFLLISYTCTRWSWTHDLTLYHIIMGEESTNWAITLFFFW